MKYLFIALALSLMIPFASNAQDENKDFGIKWSGYVKNDVIYNTRLITSARGEGELNLLPYPILLNEFDDDINAVPTFNMIGFDTRLTGKITGPDAFGAKTSGLIEGDFYGSGAAYKFLFRMRHAMMKFDWEKTQLMAGQYWHPTFVTDCFPATLAFGAGVPFNPLSRNPQIRYTYKLDESMSVYGAILSQGMFKSSGVNGDFTQKQSVFTEIHAQFQYKKDNMAAGLGINFQSLRPATTFDVYNPADSLDDFSTTIVSKENVTGLSFLGYFKMKLKPVTIKWWGLYGQLNDNMVMMGGYYPMIDTTLTLADLENEYITYTPITALTTWFEVHTNGEKMQVGLFAGYSSNMGAKLAAHQEIAAAYVGRWGNVKSAMRVAPRIAWFSGKSTIGLELEYTSAGYATQKLLDNGSVDPDGDPGGIDETGKVTNWETANNIKVLCSFKYDF